MIEAKILYQKLIDVIKIKPALLSIILRVLVKRLSIIYHFVFDLGLIRDGKMLNYITVDGKISWPKYGELQKTTLWRHAKRIRFLLNIIDGTLQPAWKYARFHHESPYPFEHLCTQGYILHKNRHRKGGNIL